MFTGLVEEKGTIRSIVARRGGREFIIEGRKTVKGLRVDDSISVEGVCLTVVKKTGKVFKVQAVEETLSKTTLGSFNEGDKVNLERSLSPGDRLGGHFVLGHVDAVGRVERVKMLGTSRMVWIGVGATYAKWLIPVGSIAVDGISLTMARVKGSTFAVAIIPHTTNVTTCSRWAPGGKVNLEFDVLGKYVETLLAARKPRRK